MAKKAIVATAASTAVSRMTINQAARLAASGEGCVIPMVLMNAFEMRRRSFIICSMAYERNGSRNR
jgi:hypothetical protein